MERKIRVLVVDDSPVVRMVFSERLSRERDIEVVGTALDAYIARDKIVRLKPDVITLDIAMPRMDGLTFLKRIMEYYPLPVIVVSAHTPEGGDLAMEAISLGAVEVVPKPSEGCGVEEVCADLARKIRGLAGVRLRAGSGIAKASLPPPKKALLPKTAILNTNTVVAMGASTGGTEALKRVLASLPADSPGILVVQHMPAHFTGAFARRLDSLCQMNVREAEDGDALFPGLVLVAPGNYHMRLRRFNGHSSVEVADGPRVHFQKPSVDVLFESVADSAGAHALGIILTGMGSDGAEGLLKMRRAGAKTISQDEESCVVFGMPKAAIRIGAVEEVLSLEDIPQYIQNAIGP